MYKNYFSLFLKYIIHFWIFSNETNLKIHNAKTNLNDIISDKHVSLNILGLLFDKLNTLFDIFNNLFDKLNTILYSIRMEWHTPVQSTVFLPLGAPSNDAGRVLGFCPQFPCIIPLASSLFINNSFIWPCPCAFQR